MHVRLAPFAGRRRMIHPAGGSLLHAPLLPLVILVAVGSASTCRRPAPAADVSLTWTLAPTPPAVGRARLTLHATDTTGRPVRAATLRVEAHMSHPGMAPVLSTATERGDGIYEAKLQFTMRGDWILLVAGSLPDGRTVQQRIDVPGVGAPD